MYIERNLLETKNVDLWLVDWQWNKIILGIRVNIMKDMKEVKTIHRNPT